MRFHDMTWPLLRQVSRDATVVVAPIAACEQHSRHLPTYTDTLLVTAVAEGVEQRLSRQVLLLPTLWFGASSHHLRFGATLSAEVDTHVAMLCDLLSPLLEDGYQRLLVLNGHGGNIDTMHMALRRLQPRHRERVLGAASYWDLAAPELAALAEGPRKNMGHACEFEPSMMLVLRSANASLEGRQKKKDPPPGDKPRVVVAFPLGATVGVASKLSLRGLKLEAATEARCQEPKATIKLLGKGRKVNLPAKQEANQ